MGIGDNMLKEKNRPYKYYDGNKDNIIEEALTCFMENPEKYILSSSWGVERAKESTARFLAAHPECTFSSDELFEMYNHEEGIEWLAKDYKAFLKDHMDLVDAQLKSDKEWATFCLKKDGYIGKNILILPGNIPVHFVSIEDIEDRLCKKKNESLCITKCSVSSAHPSYLTFSIRHKVSDKITTYKEYYGIVWDELPDVLEIAWLRKMYFESIDFITR